MHTKYLAPNRAISKLPGQSRNAFARASTSMATTAIPTANVCRIYRQKVEKKWERADPEPVFVGTGCLVNGTHMYEDLPAQCILTSHEVISYAEWCPEVTCVFEVGGKTITIRVEGQQKAGFSSVYYPPSKMNYTIVPMHEEDLDKLDLPLLELEENTMFLENRPVFICSHTQDGTDLNVMRNNNYSSRSSMLSCGFR